MVTAGELVDIERQRGQAEAVRIARGGEGGGLATPVTPTAGELIDIEREKGQAIAIATAGGEQISGTQNIPAQIISPETLFAVGQDTLNLGQSIISANQPVTPQQVQERIMSEKERQTYETFEKEITFPQKIAEKLSLGGLISGITEFRDIFVDIFKGGKQKEAYVPTQEELFQKQAQERGAYFTRPTYAGGKIVSAGTTILDITPPTAGEQFIISSSQENLASQFQADVQAGNIVANLSKSAQQELNEKFNEIQNNYTSGKATFEEANKQLQTEQERLNIKYQSLANTEINKSFKEIEGLSKQRQEEIKNKYVNAVTPTIGEMVITGAISGFSWSLPFIGPVFLGADIGQQIIKTPETIQAFATEPLKTLEQVGLFAIGAGIGYGGMKYTKFKLFEEPKIREAIKRAEVDTTFKDITSSKKISQLTFEEGFKNELQNFIDKGYTIRKAETTLRATTSADVPYLPKITGTYIEVLSRDKQIVERISLGQVIAERKGQTLTRYALGDAIGKLEGEQALFFTRNLILKQQKKGIKAVQYYETLEDLQLKEQKRTGMFFALKGEAKISMLKEVEKPTASNIFQIISFGKATPKQIETLFENLPKGKPYGEADILYGGKFIKGKMDIIKEPRLESDILTSFLIETKKIEYGKGISIFRKIQLKEKIIKPSKPWDLGLIEEKPKEIIYPQEPKLPEIKEGGFGMGLPEPLRMKAYTEIFVKKAKQVPLQQPSYLTTEIAYGFAPELVMKEVQAKSVQGVLIGTITKVQAQQLRVQPQIMMQKTFQPLIQTKSQILTQTKVMEAMTMAKTMEQTQEKLVMKQTKELTQTQALRQIQIIPRTPFVIPPVFTSFDFGGRETFDFGGRETKAREKTKKQKKQKRAYQPSIVAVQLGIIGKPRKKITGLEIRGLAPEKSTKGYAKRINKFLMG